MKNKPFEIGLCKYRSKDNMCMIYDVLKKEHSNFVLLREPICCEDYCACMGNVLIHDDILRKAVEALAVDFNKYITQIIYIDSSDGDILMKKIYPDVLKTNDSFNNNIIIPRINESFSITDDTIKSEGGKDISNVIFKISDVQYLYNDKLNNLIIKIYCTQ